MNLVTSAQCHAASRGQSIILSRSRDGDPGLYESIAAYGKIRKYKITYLQRERTALLTVSSEIALRHAGALAWEQEHSPE